MVLYICLALESNWQLFIIFINVPLTFYWNEEFLVVSEKSFLICPKLVKTSKFKSFAHIGNSFLRAAPRVFEDWPRPISSVFKHANMFLMNNSLFKNQQHSGRHFWQLARTNVTGFEKLSANSEDLLTLNCWELSNLIFNCRHSFKKLSISADSFLIKAYQTKLNHLNSIIIPFLSPVRLYKILTYGSDIYQQVIGLPKKCALRAAYLS